MMRRVLLGMFLALAGWGGIGLSTHPVFAASLCVASGSGCYSNLQDALNAAQDGDVIHVGPGTFAGGVEIDKSVSLDGTGPNTTIIRGGGPVVAIGTYGASSEPTVSISGVTITRGVTRSSPESIPFYGEAGVLAAGGGVEIPPNASLTGGATVTISNSVITGNRVAPTTAIDSGYQCPADITITCINGDLPFALAVGGGIDSWGTVTLANSTVSDNLVGTPSGLPSAASDAYGGAIMSRHSSLTIMDTTISDNRAGASAPNGRFVDGGGIFLPNGTLTMDGSTVTNNTATLAAAMPSDVITGTGAVAGGVHVGDKVTAASISNTTISGNSVTMTNTVGDSTAFSGALQMDINFSLSNDVIANNSVYSTAVGSTGGAEGDSGAGEMGGTIDNTRLTGNSVTVSSLAGTATASAGSAIFGGTMTNSVVSGNSIRVSSSDGTGFGSAGGLQTGGALTLRNTTITSNSVHVEARSGSAQGGGIFAVDESPNGPPGGPLVLINSRVTGNALSGSAGIVLQGGGLYVTNPLTLTNSPLSGNVPDNCFGSSC